MLSEEEPEEKGFLEEGFNLESHDADQKINFGTAAPKCQPKHTSSTTTTTKDEENSTGGHIHLRESRESGLSESSAQLEHRDKRQHMQQQQQQEQPQVQQDPKKLSYIQMAKLGYQELVNAIIRPPRADYKVRTSQCE